MVLEISWLRTPKHPSLKINTKTAGLYAKRKRLLYKKNSSFSYQLQSLDVHLFRKW